MEAKRQDIRHSDERVRQLSTARRRVSMVDFTGATVGGRSEQGKSAVRYMDTDLVM